MARRMPGDGAAIFRIVVVHHVMVDQPNTFERIPSGETFTTYLGPYATIGAARGQMTAETAAWNGSLRSSIASTHVQKSVTQWEDVATP